MEAYNDRLRITKEYKLREEDKKKSDCEREKSQMSEAKGHEKGEAEGKRENKREVKRAVAEKERNKREPREGKHEGRHESLSLSEGKGKASFFARGDEVKSVMFTRK